MPAQDPDELFNLCDADGVLLGRTKVRHLVHRDGDWHRSLHVWVVLVADAEPCVLFQKRSLDKDTWPGALDVAVAGHYRAGEGLAEALRESEEEIGLVLAPSDVVRLGVRRRADDHAPGIRDHEIQDVFLARTPRALTELRPAAGEVDALVALPLREAVGLFAASPGATVPGVTAHVLSADIAAPATARVSPADFVEATDGYYELALASIAKTLAAAPGVPQHPWRLG